MMGTTAERYYRGLTVWLDETGASPEKRRARLEEAVLEQLVERGEIAVPQSRVENEVNAMVCQLQQQLRYDALTTGTPHFFMQQEIDEQMESIRQEAYRQVKLELLLQQIITDEGLTVTENELRAEAAAMARRQGMPLERVMDFFGGDLSLLQGDLLVRKAIDLLCENAVVLPQGNR